jgi:hypothetical protein
MFICNFVEICLARVLSHFGITLTMVSQLIQSNENVKVHYLVLGAVVFAAAPANCFGHNLISSISNSVYESCLFNPNDTPSGEYP